MMKKKIENADLIVDHDNYVNLLKEVKYQQKQPYVIFKIIINHKKKTTL